VGVRGNSLDPYITPASKGHGRDRYRLGCPRTQTTVKKLFID